MSEKETKCGTCKYTNRRINERPCVNCVNGEGYAQTMWEPSPEAELAIAQAENERLKGYIRRIHAKFTQARVVCPGDIDDLGREIEDAFESLAQFAGEEDGK